jgi:mono/diheme cytochrome c family protein
MASIPDFTRHDWHITHSNERRLIRSVREGKGAMPATKRKLSGDDVMRLVSLVRKFSDGGQIVEEAAEPKEEPRPSADTKEPAVNQQFTAAIAPMDSQTTTKPASTSPEAGRRLFARFCVACHGADGHGSSMRSQMPVIPDFTSSRWQETRSDLQLSITILQGKGAAMPTFRGKLDEPAARRVVAYLRTFAPRPTTVPDAPATDFSQRIRRLQTELDDLRRQVRALLDQ